VDSEYELFVTKK